MTETNTVDDDDSASWPGCDTGCDDADRLARILLRLRLLAMAPTSAVASAERLDAVEVEAVLQVAAAEDLVRRRRSQPGWILTDAGRRMGEKLLDHQLECRVTGVSRQASAASRRAEVSRRVAVSRRSMIRSAYEKFIPLNAEVLALCTRWQVKQLDPVVLNDHTDAAYDARATEDLAAVHERARSMWRMLATGHDRFARYEKRFDHALQQVETGRTDWFTIPTVDSYHTIWFELHEDLLATLGLDRSREHARWQQSDDKA